MTRLSRLLLALALAFGAAPAAADDAGAVQAAMTRATAGDWAGAAAAAAPAGPVAADLVEWTRLRAGEGLLGEYEAFLARRPDWPGLPLLREKGEEAVARSTTPARVIGYFGGAAPQTADGAIALVTALAATGRGDEAQGVARRAWTDLSFDEAEQAEMLALQGAALADRHVARLDALLWRGDAAGARRMLPLVPTGWQALAKARLALQAKGDGVTALIKAVPADLAGDPGLARDRFIWRMDRGLYPEATELILERSATAGGLGRPEAWATRRASLARLLIREGKPDLAYRVAAGHGLEGGGDFADLEFLAGFVALRKQGDPGRALPHFRHLQAAVATPISLSRALYWQGRALEAAGEAEGALAAFRAASRHQTAYYGQLALERLGLPLDDWVLTGTETPDWRQAEFTGSSVFLAGRMLLEAGSRTLGKRFLLHLAESLDATELDQLAAFATERNEPHVALLVAKAAAERGAILPRPYFPVPGMVPEEGLSVSRAFALAVSRRESEFDPAARSPADARGLMQLLPGTAKMMAAELGLPYQLGRLTSDPGYNARLGTAYLKVLVDEFGPAVALVASGYNAGPGRPRRWIEELGDPRSDGVDVVDWVETIPFTETRTYVMRVAESLVIYRAKLKGDPGGPVRLTSELTGR